MPIRVPPKVELDRVRFAEFLRARDGLIRALEIEERFNMLLENYAEFETELLQQSLYHMMFEDVEWSRFADVIHTFNRRLNNLLSTCRLYLDQTSGTLSTLYGAQSQIREDYEQSRRAEYDAGFAYRVMEAIRNYAQHRNLPVGRVSVQNGDFPGYERTLNHHLIVPCLDVEGLRRDSEFKRSVLAELDGTGARYIDVRMFVRLYVEALGRIHAKVNAAIAPDLGVWDSMMSELRSRFENMWDGSRWHHVLVACTTAESGSPEESFVVEEAVKRRIALAGRNCHVTSYSRQVVSNFAGTPV